MTRWFVHNGVGLRWRKDVDPKGRPVLHLNSLRTDMRIWDDLVPDMRIICIDTRGHGLCDTPDDRYALQDLAADVGAPIDELMLTDLIIIGVSHDGAMAQVVVVSRPDGIIHLMLPHKGLHMGTTEKWRTRLAAVQTGGVRSIADAVLDSWFGAACRHSPALPLWRDMLTRTPSAGYAGCCAAQVTQLASRLNCKTTVISGAQASADPPAFVRTAAAPIPNATDHEIADGRHFPMVETPEAFAAIVTSALKEPAHV